MSDKPDPELEVAVEKLMAGDDTAMSEWARKAGQKAARDHLRDERDFGQSLGGRSKVVGFRR